MSQKSVTVLMKEAVREMQRVEPHRDLGALLQTPERPEEMLDSKIGGKNVGGKKM